ncbi:phosphoribosyltransferase family protein [Bellilinea sp.]|jgi:adenine phosphoribosyltransferase|uniref:Adenine phosphoribosyltransferase n=1 Tax=Bellilinea caldifistulae TaxID=360411 RepID=A0A7C4Q2V1_9CHLR|nr:phosphoribosyltransferase family protein [Bellilinea sp.]
MVERETYAIELAGLHRELPLFEVKPGLKIAILNILGDTPLVEACAEALAQKSRDRDFDVIVTAESKSIPLAYAMSVRLNKPYVVLRKVYKFYMGEALKAQTLSITTGEPQTLFLDEKDHRLLRGKKVMILDDVISTGSTLEGMRSLMEQAGATVTVEAAICTEGESARWNGIVALAHLPLFEE